MNFNKIRTFYRIPRYILIETRKCCSTNSQTQNVPTPDTDVQQKLLRVAVIGMPNSGKSTFINHLMDRKVCPTSSKVHTTRTKASAIFTEGDSQIIFVDTPGIVNDREMKRRKLEQSFIKDCNSSLNHADIIGVIHDVSDKYVRERLDIKIINLLEQHVKKPSFLVLNKIDILKSKRKLLDVTRLLTENCIGGVSTITMGKNHKQDDPNTRGWRHFAEVFMVSSLTGSGLPELKQFLLSKAKPGKWMYPENVWTDQTPEQIIVNSVKAKFLDFLPQEMPYLLKPYMEFFEIDDAGIITAVVLVDCPSPRICKLIAGQSDGRLNQIIRAVQEDMQVTFQNFVRIKIVLQVRNKEAS